MASLWSGLSVAGAAVLVAGATLAQQTPLDPPTPDSRCVAPQPLPLEMKLDGDCVYRQSLSVERSGTTLDCQGALIDGGQLLQDGIVIGAQTQISDITVRNCRVANFRRMGIYVRTSVPAPGGRPQEEIDRRYAFAPKDVTIDKVQSSSNGDAGVFIGDHVVGSSVIDSTIENNNGPGIYLEFSSRGNMAAGNLIRHNGWSRSGVAQREGLAIDSSASNQIVKNKFLDNGLGGVFIYKNCGERGGPSRTSPIRWQQSISNVVKDNLFSGRGTGVWLASRQSVDESAARCGDGYYFEGRYALDYASGNRVEHNTFRGVPRPVVIEDDNNAVVDNRIEGAQICVLVGTPIRSAVLGQPVKNTTIVANSCSASGGKGYVSRFGSIATDFRVNKLNGVPASLEVEP